MTTTTTQRRRATDAPGVRRDNRRRMPRERSAITHKFNVGGFEFYLIVGLYEDGAPGEIFLRSSKVGSAVHGFTDTFAILFSMALQAGVPLSAIVGKFRNVRFDPSDPLDVPGVREGGAPSIPAYVVRWMEKRFLLDPQSAANVGEVKANTAKVGGGAKCRKKSP